MLAQLIAIVFVAFLMEPRIMTVVAKNILSRKHIWLIFVKICATRNV